MMELSRPITNDEYFLNFITVKSYSMGSVNTVFLKWNEANLTTNICFQIRTALDCSYKSNNKNQALSENSFIDIIKHSWSIDRLKSQNFLYVRLIHWLGSLDSQSTDHSLKLSRLTLKLFIDSSSIIQTIYLI